MSTQEQLTPQGFRTAAYLEARARMDFVRSRTGKTNRKVQCRPPNTKCGGRCIPPEWDCRLKGEGADPKLRAVKFDPVGGLANVQRGAARFVKGLQRGNFSEIEGGKRALIRGTVKLTPGDIQKKEELRTWLENNFIKAGVALAVLGGAGGLHYALYRSNSFGYRYGAGRRVNEAAERGVNTILDLVPVWGAERRRVRTTAGAAAERVTGRARRFTAEGPEALKGNLGRGSESLLENPRAVAPINDGRDALTKALNKANKAGSKDTFYNWNQRHRSAFWGTTRNKHNIYSESATNEFLSDVFSIPQADRGSTERIKFAIQRQIESDRIRLLDLARQEGFRTSFTNNVERLSPENAAEFARRVVKRSSGVAPEVSEQLERQIRRAVTDTPFTAANRTYNETLQGYDDYFARVSELNQVTAGVPLNAEQRSQGQDLVIKAGDTRRAEFLLRQMQRSGRPAGPSHVELISRDFYHTRVAQGSTPQSQYSITDRLAQSAAVELSGRQSISVSEAFEYLNSQGYRVTRVQRARKAPTKPPTPPTPTETSPTPKPPSPEQREGMREYRKSRSQLIKRLMEEGYTRETAARMVDENRIPLDMFDSESPRVEAYLEARARLDKRCGKSGIPDTKKCSKPTAAQSEEARNRERGRKTPGVTCNPPNKQCGNLCIPPTATCHVRGGGSALGNAVSIAGKAALTAGVLAGGVAAYRNRRPIMKVAKTVGATAKGEYKLYQTIKKRKLGEKNSYGGNKYTQSSATRAARKEYIENRKQLAQATYRKYAPQVLNKGIKRLSQDDIRQKIETLPAEWRPKASQLLGKAKSAMAVMSADAQGFKIKNINTKSNFSTYATEDGSKIISIGSVGDTLVTFNADKSSKIDLRTESGRGVDVYDIQFMSDLGFDQKKGVAKKDSIAIGSMIKSMNTDSIKQLPTNAVLRNIPYGDDGLGRKRLAIYKKFGYKQLRGIRGQAMFATLSNGKVVPIDPKYEDFYADLLKGDSYEKAVEKFESRSRGDSVENLIYFDKKCGKSGIPQNKKCSKPIVQRVGEAALTAALVTGVSVAAGTLLRARRQKQGLSPEAAKNIVKNTAQKYKNNPPKVKITKTKPVSQQPHEDTTGTNFWDPSKPRPASARPMPTGPGQEKIIEAGLLPPQRTYKENSKYDIPFQIGKTAVRRGNTVEAFKVAELIKRGQIKTNGKLTEDWRTMIDRNVPESVADQLNSISRSIESSDDYIPYGGFVSDPKMLTREYQNYNFKQPWKNKGASIYLNHTRDTLNLEPDRTTIRTQLRAGRASSIKYAVEAAPTPASDVKDLKVYADALVTSGRLKGSNYDAVTYTHETMHVIDLHMNKGVRPSQTAAQRKKLMEEAEAYGLTFYGRQDISTTMNEFIAEAGVHYVWDSAELKRRAPTIYAMIDSIIDSALSKFSS